MDLCELLGVASIPGVDHKIVDFPSSAKFQSLTQPLLIFLIKLSTQRNSSPGHRNKLSSLFFSSWCMKIEIPFSVFQSSHLALRQSISITVYKQSQRQGFINKSANQPLMLEFDEKKKLEKFKNCKEQLGVTEQKEKPKMWEEMDDMEKEEREVLYSEDELSQGGRKRRKEWNIDETLIKKQKQIQKHNSKISQVEEYTKGLENHRKKKRVFCSPYDGHKLRMDIKEAIRKIQRSKTLDVTHVDVALCLKMVGIKSRRTLHEGGTRKQLELVLNFLKNGVIPDWIYKDFEELKQKKARDFNGTVKKCLKF